VILHFCPERDWVAAQPDGAYVADSLATEGFIHCSTPELIHLAANRHAHGRRDLVLLEVDETRLDQPPRFEPGDPTDPASPLYPHVYGPIPVAAVVGVREWRPGPDGSFAPLG
jgi:uncharacterized protein (DUF952 family)